MEESQKILLNSLTNSGLPIPPGVSTIRDLTPSTLFSVCSHALRLIDPKTSFPNTLPEDSSMSDRFNLCSELASAFKSLGFLGDISFHKFLYPSEEDLYKLARFLVERLPGVSGYKKDVEEKTAISSSQVRTEGCIDESPSGSQLNESGGLRLQIEKLALLEAEAVDGGFDLSRPTADDYSKNVFASTKNVLGSVTQLQDMKIGYLGDAVAAPIYEHHVPEGLQNISSFEAECKIGKLLRDEDLLAADLNRRSSELQNLLYEHALYSSAVEMACHDKHHVDFYLKDVRDQGEMKRKNLEELESQWEVYRAPMEEKRGGLEKAVAAKLPEADNKLEQLKRIELETESVLAEIKQREEELCKLSAALENQPPLAPRKSYVQRIKEITKNSRKQEIDIERILRETRELQLESNSIQERLYRTYAVVDETVFREAKKDPGGQLVYRLLVSIHENFRHIAEKILTADRTRREVADYEAKLAILTSQSLNLDKVKSDLDAIRKENDLLEQRMHASNSEI